MRLAIKNVGTDVYPELRVFAVHGGISEQIDNVTHVNLDHDAVDGVSATIEIRLDRPDRDQDGEGVPLAPLPWGSAVFRTPPASCRPPRCEGNSRG